MANLPKGFLTILQRCERPLLNISHNVRCSSKGINDIEIRHRPKPMDKRFLVWSGKYKTVEEIPEYVSIDTMLKAKSKIRIRFSNILIGVGLIGSIVMVITGKRAAARGESIAKMNVDWHKEINAKPRET